MVLLFSFSFRKDKRDDGKKERAQALQYVMLGLLADCIINESGITRLESRELHLPRLLIVDGEPAISRFLHTALSGGQFSPS